MAPSNSQSNDTNYSTAEVEASAQASITSITANSQQQSGDGNKGQRQRPRRQTLLDEFFGGNEKRRRIQDPVSSAIAIMRKVVQPKEKGRRRTSDSCDICIEEYEFLAIDETTGEQCCEKKPAHC